MKQIFITIACILCISGIAKADHVGNGGGIAEKNIVLAYERLDQFIKLCMSSQSCKLSEREKTLLVRILSALPTEKLVKDQIQFASEKASPGTFVINGEIKVAKTGSTVGSQIFFNVDLLYAKNSRGDVEVFSLAQSVAQMIHELGHHHGDYDHTELDFLGIKVSLVLTQHVQETPFLPLDNQVSAYIINEPGSYQFSQIILYVFGELVDVSKAFESSVICTRLRNPGDTSEGGEKVIISKPKSAVFHNAYWSDYKIEDYKGRFKLKGNITNICRQGDALSFKDNSYRATVYFEIQKKPSSDGKSVWALKKDSIKIDQLHEPWWKIIRLP